MTTEWGFESNVQGHRFPMNLQLFAEGGEGSDGAEGGGEPPVAYTQEQFDAALQKETDRRVTSALKKAQEKWQAEYEEKIEKERSEAEELAKLSAAEREKKKHEKDLAQLAKDRAAFELEKMEFQTQKELAAADIDSGFAKFLIGKDAEKTSENISEFSELFNAQVAAAVEAKLGGKPPRGGNSGSKLEENPFSKEHWNMTKQIELKKNDPELYEELKKTMK